MNVTEWVSECYQSLTAHQHQKGHTVPKQVITITTSIQVVTVQAPHCVRAFAIRPSPNKMSDKTRHLGRSTGRLLSEWSFVTYLNVIRLHHPISPIIGHCFHICHRIIQVFWGGICKGITTMWHQLIWIWAGIGFRCVGLNIGGRISYCCIIYC